MRGDLFLFTSTFPYGLTRQFYNLWMVFSGTRCSVGMNICGVGLDLNNDVSFDLFTGTNLARRSAKSTWALCFGWYLGIFGGGGVLGFQMYNAKLWRTIFACI